MRSKLISVAAVAGWVVLTTSVWAWALGFVVWHGAVAGAVLGPPIGICLVWLLAEAEEMGDLSGAGVMGCGIMLFGLLLVLPIIGAIVGLVRLVFW